MGNILKGKVKVQLFDALTGREVDRREGHNIITNAAHYLTNGAPYGLDRRTWANTAANAQTDWSDIYSKVFGGILVFPSSITESAAHLFEPLSNYPVGYGSMLGQDVSDSKSGTYNGVESGPITGGFKYVYDFGTSQGNGSWDTVCLTSAKGGYGYIEGRTDGTIFDSYFRREIGTNTYYIGSTTNYAYFISEFYGTATLSRLAIRPFEIPLYGNDIQGVSATVLTVADTDRIFIDHDNDYIYTLAISGQNLTVTRYNDEDDLTDTTVYNITSPLTVPEYNRGRYDFCVRDGYLYMGNRGTTVIKINLTTPADNDEITVTAHTHAYSVIGMSIRPTGDIYRFPDIIDENDDVHTIGSADASGASLNFANWYNNWAVCDRSDYGYAGAIDTTYLATIKNLDSPITKDASKTAKITYELVEVSE